MELVGFKDDEQPIVSSWGQQFILDTNGTFGGNNDNWTWPVLDLVCVNYEDHAKSVFDDPSVLYQ